uniref:Uncharacterized protein n=1 Tax=Schistosoma haematobium TaxID=6185 RepID=A0A095AK85_SCHHA
MPGGRLLSLVKLGNDHSVLQIDVICKNKPLNSNSKFNMLLVRPEDPKYIKPRKLSHTMGVTYESYSWFLYSETSALT